MLQVRIVLPLVLRLEPGNEGYKLLAGSVPGPQVKSL